MAKRCWAFILSTSKNLSSMLTMPSFTDRYSLKLSLITVMQAMSVGVARVAAPCGKQAWARSICVWSFGRLLIRSSVAMFRVRLCPFASSRSTSNPRSSMFWIRASRYRL